MASNLRSAAGALVFLGGLGGDAAAVQAQQILTAIESRLPGPGVEPKVAKSSAVAGKLLATTYGGVDTRALTDFGVNKVYVQGAGPYIDGADNYRSYATSNWIDSYTVGGAANSMVNVSFTFRIDGRIDVPNDPYSAVTTARIDYSVYALRGNGYTLSGYGGSAGDPVVTPAFSADRYDDLLLTRVTPTTIVEIPVTRYGGVYTYTNIGGLPGTGTGRSNYDRATDLYSYEQQIGAIRRVTQLSATGFKATDNGVSITGPGFLPYSFSPAALNLRNQLVRNFAVLDVARLCDSNFGYCPAGTYPGSDLTVSFTLAAGSTFTLLSSLHANDLYEGTLDFFNTARLTGASVSPGGSLTSESGALTQLAGGGYGYVAGVPEPASWALLLAGFGLTGAMQRRRRVLPQVCA